MTPVAAARPDTEVVFDPATYVTGVPFDALARLRRDTPVDVAGGVEDDLGVRPGRPVGSLGHCCPRNSSMEVASTTGHSNIG